MKEGCESLFLIGSEIIKAGVETVGGKSWNLARLEHYGFKVPTGGVLAAEAYQLFIEENNLLSIVEKTSQKININNIGEKEIEKRLSLIREEITRGHIPASIQEELFSNLKRIGILGKPLAVRSSATAEDSCRASFAGIHQSFLNVQEVDDILSAIKACYASLWTGRAVAYRRKMDIRDNEVIPAVLIMQMVEASAAGVGFSCDPRTGREDIVLISANFGLGESVVSGTVQPDEYFLDSALEMKEKNIGRKEGKIVCRENGGTEFVETPEAELNQVLRDEDIGKLALLIQRVYDALGYEEQHQDIEWAFDGEDFTLLQARPVTALPRYTFAALKKQADIWSNANLKDAMPMVQSTLNWSLTKSKGVDNELLGLQSLPGLKQLRLYQGRAYFNLSVQQWVFFETFGMTPRQINESLGGHQPEIEIVEKKPYRGIKGCKRLGRVMKLLYLIHKTRKKAPESFKRVDEFSGILLNENLLSLSDNKLIKTVSEIRAVWLELWPVFYACNMSANVIPLVKALEKYFPGRGKILANILVIGRGNICSAEHGYHLLELAEMARRDRAAWNFLSSSDYNPLLWEKELPEDSSFKLAFRSFLAEYGHRGVYEMDIINPRWREDPSYLLNIIRTTVETAQSENIKERQREITEEAWREIKEKMPFLRYQSIKGSLEKSIKGMELREMAKSELVKIYDSRRLVFQEIGRRFTERGLLFEQADIYHCTWNEVFPILKGDWNGRGLNVLVADRKARRKKMEALSPPNFIIDELPQFVEAVSCSTDSTLTGMGVSAGRASGLAKLIYHPHEGGKLQSGDVLLAPSTDPAWTPLFLRAAAIVVETGGWGSHGSIVAREYGVPAVVNMPGVMQVIQDGQKLLVDGNEGKVFLQ